MSGTNSMSRRRFVAGASSLALAGAAGEAAEKTASKKGSRLAIDGGEKAVKVKPVAGPRWGETERKQLEAMLQQGSLFYWKGPQTKLLLERFREVCPVKYAHNCSSGAAALHIAVAAAGIGLGDEVITSPVTDIGTVIGVLYQQAVPVFADLGLGTHNLDPADVEKCITGRTKVIMPVHMLGVPARMDEIMAIAGKRGVTVLEDSAQACGSSYKGKKTGTIAPIGCFSFDYVKTITTGEGGMLATDDEELYDRASWFHDHGHRHLTDRPRGEDTAGCPGFNYRMNEIQGAIGIVQLALDDPAAAESAFRRALAIDPAAPEPMIQRTFSELIALKSSGVWSTKRKAAVPATVCTR